MRWCARLGCGVQATCHSRHTPETGGAWTPRPCLAQTPKHKEYLDFFPKIGISNDFYWFTLEAATYTGMYYMTKADLQKYRYATDYEGSGDTDQLYCENLDKIKIRMQSPGSRSSHRGRS